jgi:hypothetical protein
MIDDFREETEKKAKALLCDKCLAAAEAVGMKIPVRELCDKCSDRLLRWALGMEGFENEETN